MTARRSRDIPIALPMKRNRTMRQAPPMWLWRPAAGRLGGVSPPVFSPQVDPFTSQPYSRSRIHTDAIKDTLIPPSITKAQAFKERGRPWAGVALRSHLAHIDSLHFSVSDFDSVYAGCGFADLAKFAIAHMAFSLSAFTQSPSSAKPPNNGATPTPVPWETSAIMPRWSNSSSSPTLFLFLFLSAFQF